MLNDNQCKNKHKMSKENLKKILENTSEDILENTKDDLKKAIVIMHECAYNLKILSAMDRTGKCEKIENIYNTLGHTRTLCEDVIRKLYDMK